MFERLSSAQLAVLGREYLLAGHLIDRAGMPHVVSEFGLDAMRDVAIEEWMGASPVYTRRMQRALGFAGDDVATIFRGMQLDIGAPHQFMDFRYRVDDEHHGEFWLASCGALMDVEPLGDDFVVAVCHHIEDPTFDATACASNPRARMRPIHRPPRLPAGRHPHCHWTVDIDPDAEALPEPEAAALVARSRAARVVIGGSAEPGGARAFDPEFKLEDLARDALVVVLQELCLQGHLLAHSFLLAIDRRFGHEAARRIGRKQAAGIAGLAAGRVARAVGAGRGLSSIARVLELHPAFHPRAYVDLDVEQERDRLVVSLRDCAALEEEAGWSWAAQMANGDHAPLDAIAQVVDPQARVHATSASRCWDIVVDANAPPAAEAPEVTVTRFSTGADFVFS